MSSRARAAIATTWWPSSGVALAPSWEEPGVRGPPFDEEPVHADPLAPGLEGRPHGWARSRGPPPPVSTAPRSWAARSASRSPRPRSRAARCRPGLAAGRGRTNTCTRSWPSYRTPQGRRRGHPRRGTAFGGSFPPATPCRSGRERPPSAYPRSSGDARGHPRQRASGVAPSSRALPARSTAHVGHGHHVARRRLRLDQPWSSLSIGLSSPRKCCSRSAITTRR